MPNETQLKLFPTEGMPQEAVPKGVQGRITTLLADLILEVWKHVKKVGPKTRGKNNG